MEPEKVVRSYEEFCYLREELDMRESEALTAIEDMKWLKENPVTMTKKEFQRLKSHLANISQIKEAIT